MADKTSEWRPGPTVCRCCLAEGCYKDISTEYFWMGKREVYAEMLAETFSVSIAYSKSGGPNSNSRLICEPCISRLRDASDFKKQVQECEKTFMQYLDPGSSSTTLESEVQTSSTDKRVKVEQVKIERQFSDDEFDSRDFGDDDDDDDMDQPLTTFASKEPKKETVNLMELLASPQLSVKRKAPAQTKTVSVKKVKVIKKDARGKPTTSKAAQKNEDKKKKGQTEEISLIREKQGASYLAFAAPPTGDRDELKREVFRNNIATILESCTAYPFKYRKGTYMCFYCNSSFLDPSELREHTHAEHPNPKPSKPRKYEPLKMDFANINCKICGQDVEDYATLRAHVTEHGKVIDLSHGESVLPYKLNGDAHYCQICGKHYEVFLTLHKHMNDHYQLFICEHCGKKFATSQRMVNHSITHETGAFPCNICGKIFNSYSSKYAHVCKVHKANTRYKCPICDVKFVSYKQRLKHLTIVHGQKPATFPCPSCPKVFDLCSRRTAHIRHKHLQERNHVCSVCGMKFFSKYELKEHSIKHGGERIYQCDVCKKAYARLKTLREHMRIHNNERRFICPVCGQTFVQKCSLKQHMRVHHPT
ncbi:zinc finger protein 568-like isoform X10 [Bombyx mori]|uniref:Uncharacterized protein n=1 Tax=Bombyx mori TaxID=7091 RepID=A0A8R2R2Q4_BOMMO|nr:ferritin isoform X9 [Bombyx mori]